MLKLKSSTGRAVQVLASGGLLAATSAPLLPAWSQQAPAPPQVLEEAPAQAPVLISEVRAYGPGGAEDSFVEVSNASDKPLDLSGWSLQFLNPARRLVSVPLANATVVPPRGHLLLAGRSYSLGAYARPDVPLPEAIASGVRLRDTQGRTVDAVGPRDSSAATSAAPGAEPSTSPRASGEDLAFSEGRGLEPWAFAGEGNGVARPPQFSCVRRSEGGKLRDGGDNARDWAVVSVTAALGGRAVRLGAPGPQNRSSAHLAIEARPVQEPPEHAAVAPQAPQPVASSDATGGAGKSSEAALAAQAAADRSRKLAPLRERASVGANRSRGTLVLRYRLVNESGQALRRFQLRVVGATTGAAPEGIADVRLLPLPRALKPRKPAAGARTSASTSSAAASAAPRSAAAGDATPILYGELDEPPTQARGGGLNSSLSFEPGPEGLAPGSAAELRILLGVEKLGRYRLALDGGGLKLVFSGHLQPRAVQAEVTDSWARSSAFASSSQAAQQGGSAQGGAPSADRAGESGGSEGRGNLVIAAIILEGNTEDGVEPPAPKSPLKLFSSEVGGGTIRLRFGGPIEVASLAEGATFAITINGREVEGAAAAVGQNTVLLRLPEGTMRRGDRVTIRWDNLRDAQGRVVSGVAGPLTVP